MDLPEPAGIGTREGGGWPYELAVVVLNSSRAPSSGPGTRGLKAEEHTIPSDSPSQQEEDADEDVHGEGDDAEEGGLLG